MWRTTVVKIFVVWEHDYDDPNVKEYDFDTPEEVAAFLLGLDETDTTGEWFHVCDSKEEAHAYLKSTGRAEA
jgi:hypothetical protein